MLKKTIKFTDYNGTEREQDYFFNLTKAEVIKMELTTEGGLQAMIEKITKEQDAKKIISVFEELISLAYGEKDAAGVHFNKSPELSRAFMQTEAYSVLFMELLEDSEAAAAFFKGIMPQDLMEKAGALPAAV